MAIIGYKFYGRNIRPYLEESERKPRTVLGLTLLSLIIFGAFAIRPSLYTISRLRQEVKKAHEAKIILDQKIVGLGQAQVNYQLAVEDLKLVDHALPTEEAVPAILEGLALAAGRNKVTLNETEFAAVEGEAPLKTLPLTLVVTGDLVGVERFITELENGVRQMNVQRVRINRGGEELEYLVAEIELEVYFYE